MSNNFYRSIERKIKDTDDEINKTNKLDIDKNIKELLLTQLNERKEELKKEKIKMDKLYGKEQIRLTISGEEIGKGEVPIRILADTLSNIPNMINCIANSMKNELNKKGEKILLDFATDVMIAASVWSLLIPSIAIARD